MYTRTVGALLTHCPRRQGSHACMNRKRAAQHSCTCMHLKACACVQTQIGGGGARSLARSLPALQFPSLTLNQSFLIYQKGFVSWRLMPTPIRGKKTTQQQWKSQSKSLLWCDYTHNQIRADLNRHRTQNHIKGNSMWMALHCSQSPFPNPPYPLSALLSLILSLTFFLHFSLSLFCHHHHCLLIFYRQWPEKFLTSDLYFPLLWVDPLFSARSTKSAIHPPPRGKTLVTQVGPGIDDNR